MARGRLGVALALCAVLVVAGAPLRSKPPRGDELRRAGVPLVARRARPRAVAGDGRLRIAAARLLRAAASRRRCCPATASPRSACPFLLIALLGLGAAFALGRKIAGMWGGIGAAAVLAVTPPFPVQAARVQADTASVVLALCARRRARLRTPKSRPGRWRRGDRRRGRLGEAAGAARRRADRRAADRLAVVASRRRRRGGCGVRLGRAPDRVRRRLARPLGLRRHRSPARPGARAVDRRQRPPRPSAPDRVEDAGRHPRRRSGLSAPFSSRAGSRRSRCSRGSPPPPCSSSTSNRSSTTTWC